MGRQTQQVPSLFSFFLSLLTTWLSPGQLTADSPVGDFEEAVNNIKAVIDLAVAQTGNLVGQPLTVVLKTVDGVVLTVPQLANIIAAFIAVRPLASLILLLNLNDPWQLVVTPLVTLVNLTTSELKGVITPLVACIW
jgi:hypothetical protein